MRLLEEQRTAFYSHFPVPDSLTLQERIAILSLSEEEDIAYFVSNDHLVTREFGTPDQYRLKQQAVGNHVLELLQEAS